MGDIWQNYHRQVRQGREDTEDRRKKKYKLNKKNFIITISSWLNCALRDDEAVYWVNIGHYEAVAVGN